MKGNAPNDTLPSGTPEKAIHVSLLAYGGLNVTKMSIKFIHNSI